MIEDLLAGRYYFCVVSKEVEPNTFAFVVESLMLIGIDKAGNSLYHFQSKAYKFCYVPFDCVFVTKEPAVALATERNNNTYNFFKKMR